MQGLVFLTMATILVTSEIPPQEQGAASPPCTGACGLGEGPALQLAVSVTFRKLSRPAWANARWLWLNNQGCGA